MIKLNHLNKFFNQLISLEISIVSRYYDQVFHFEPLSNDKGEILRLVDCPVKQVINREKELPDLSQQKNERSIILLNGNLNYHFDIQSFMMSFRPKLARSTRVVIVIYNSYLKWIYGLANFLRLRFGEQPSTFITYTDLNNLAKLSGYEIVRTRPCAFVPFKLLGIGSLLNKIMPAIPFFNRLSMATIAVLRPVVPLDYKPSLTIIIPARNERGNIEKALQRLSNLQTIDLEIIFIEGHSNDKTWDEIQRVISQYSKQFKIKAFQQTGIGKNDAVRLGFSYASGELLTILDADLTMPPELLHRFYDAYCMGIADFINGNRLVYPMEGEAMQFLNRGGNIFFAKALSFVLDTKLGDSLCGTKLLLRTDYERIVAWRKDFGDFDPFGDFELLFSASILGLGIADIPIRYLDRTYGSTNISRFHHGWMLLKMTMIGLFRIKMANISYKLVSKRKPYTFIEKKTNE